MFWGISKYFLFSFWFNPDNKAYFRWNINNNNKNIICYMMSEYSSAVLSHDTKNINRQWISTLNEEFFIKYYDSIFYYYYY